jgi:hypothetical protein
MSSGPLRTVRTAARAADRSGRSGHFGRLLSYSAVCVQWQHTQGAWDATGYARGACIGGGTMHQQKTIGARAKLRSHPHRQVARERAWLALHGAGGLAGIHEASCLRFRFGCC